MIEYSFDFQKGSGGERELQAMKAMAADPTGKHLFHRFVHEPVTVIAGKEMNITFRMMRKT